MICNKGAVYMREFQTNIIQDEIDKIIEAIETKIKEGAFNSCSLNKNIINVKHYDVIADVLVKRGFSVMLVGDEIKISWKEN